MKYPSRILIRRAIEIIIVEFVLSAVGATLVHLDFSSSRLITFVTSFVVMAVYLVWSGFCLFQIRLYVNGKKAFYLINAPFYGVLFAGAIAAGFFDSEPVYTFMFMPFKLFHYAATIWYFPGSEQMSRPVSAALVCVIFALPLILMPVVVSTERKMALSGAMIHSERE